MKTFPEINGLNAEDTEAALSLGCVNLRALTPEARNEVQPRLCALADRLRRLRATEARREPELKTVFSVEAHPYSPRHLLFKVVTGGRVWACASAWDGEAEPKPGVAEVRYCFEHSRHQFLPYNEVMGVYVGAGRKS